MKALGQQQMAGLEHFELRHHARVLDRQRHLLQVRRRIDEHAVAHVEAAHVETANVGLDLQHMLHALFRRAEHAFGPGLRWVMRIVVKARARPGGKIDQYVGAARPDALDRLAIMRGLHARLAGIRIAHVDVDDGGARLCGVDRRCGDLRGRHRHRRVAPRRIGRAGHRAGDDHLALHTPLPQALLSASALAADCVDGL